MRETHHRDLLHDLLNEIEQGMIGDDWSVSLDTVLLCVETGAESFYRFYYKSGQSMSDLPETFTAENVRILIDFLDSLGFNDAADAFRSRGWYVTDEDYLSWEEFFLSVSLSILASHQIDEEELEIALAGCRNWTDGLQFYCQTRCSTESLLSRTLAIFASERSLHRGSVQLLRRYTHYLFHRRLFREETLYAELQRRLLQRASERGWIHADVIPAPASLREELLLFGFQDLPNEDILKDRYRSLLKDHHPDVNRSSDAVLMTQRLIDAYAKICAFRRQKDGVLS